MALADNIKALIDSGVKEHEIQQALRKVMDEKLKADHAIGLPAIPTIPPALWVTLKAKLLERGGPTNKYQLLVDLHAALEADDQPKFWASLFGMVKAVWHEHPGHRR